MALLKQKSVHGVSGNYWQIAHKNYAKDTGKTAVLLRCYVSAAVRAAGLENFVGMPEFQVIKEFDGDLTTAECYTQAKASVVADETETNFFVDAEDLV